MGAISSSLKTTTKLRTSVLNFTEWRETQTHTHTFPRPPSQEGTFFPQATERMALSQACYTTGPVDAGINANSTNDQFPKLEKSSLGLYIRTPDRAPYFDVTHLAIRLGRRTNVGDIQADLLVDFLK